MAGQIFEPLMIGPVAVPNRIVRAAHDTGFARPDITDRFIEYHVARARGGCGLSILEAGRVHPSTGLDLQLYGDQIVAGYRRLMAAVDPHGMRVFQQLWHGGNLYYGINGKAPWAVSHIAGYWGVVGQPMNGDQIAELRDAFVTAALNAQEGGLQGVEVHAGHGYLFHQFLSRHYNNRTDEYGGSFDNRARFLMDTLRAIRAAVSPTFVVGIRLSASGAPGGVSEDDNRRLIRAAEEERLIDFVDLSKGDYHRMATMVGTMEEPGGYELSSTTQMGSVATVPRIVTGRFRTVEEAEQVLRDGHADLVSMVRAQIADPDLVRKEREGRADTVRPCIACNQGCIGGLFRVGTMGCTVNPAVGSEAQLAESLIERSPIPRRVAVVGGGPAGMEAARIAAMRGHKVILFEAQPVLGGATAIARSAPFLQSLGDIIYWLENEVYRLGVDVRLSNYVEADDIRALAPDAVVVATGSLPRVDAFQVGNPALSVPGVDLAHVMSSQDLLTRGKSDLGTHALVLDTVGHYESIAVTEHLMRRGLSVTFLTHAVSMTPYVQSTWRDVPALERLFALGDIDILTRHQLLEIEPGRCMVQALQASHQQRRYVRADTVILVTQNAPLRALYDDLGKEGLALHLVGDAMSPRDVQAAIAEGHQVARSLF